MFTVKFAYICYAVRLSFCLEYREHYFRTWQFMNKYLIIMVN